jgi:hypothetical protein
VLDILSRNIDLQEAKCREDEGDDRKRCEIADLPANLLKGAKKPAHVEILSHMAHNGNPVSLEPIDGLRVQHLKAVDIVDEPLADSAESPHCQERQHGNGSQDRQDGDSQCQQLRNLGLKRALKGSHDGDDE